MANIVIEKRVSLDYLGAKHKESYVLFKAMPVGKYTDFVTKVKKTTSNEESTKMMVDVLTEQFISGKFAGEEINKEDIAEFDPENILKFFQYLTGQVTDEEGKLNLDPKDESESTSTSTTDQEAA